jgi:hypothetical protein
VSAPPTAYATGTARAAAALLAALLLVGRADAAGAAPPAKPAWTFRIVQGDAAPTEIVVRNQCQGAHSYTLSAPGSAWIHFEVPVERLRVEGRSSRAVPLRFDSTGLKPGVYLGELVVDCLTCAREAGCASKRDAFPVEMTVVTGAERLAAGAGAPPPHPPAGEVRNVESAMRSRMGDAMARLAGKRGLSIVPESLAVLSLPEGGLVAGVGLAGLEKLTAAQLAKGAEVLFLHAELAANGKEIPAGDYTLLLQVKEEGAAGAAQLIDARGAVARQLPVSVEHRADGATIYLAQLAPELALPVWCMATAPPPSTWSFFRNWPVRCLPPAAP